MPPKKTIIKLIIKGQLKLLFFFLKTNKLEIEKIKATKKNVGTKTTNFGQPTNRLASKIKGNSSRLTTSSRYFLINVKIK